MNKHHKKLVEDREWTKQSKDNSPNQSNHLLLLQSLPISSPPSPRSSLSMAQALLFSYTYLGLGTHFTSKSNHIRQSPSLSPSSKPLMITVSHSQSYWTSVHADIMIYLQEFVKVKPPLSVFEPMRHLVFSAPRTTAPALCVAACEFSGGSRHRAMAAAAALHLMHVGAFTHEHLSLSNGPMMRPITGPNVEHIYGPNIELLTGDGIFPFGYELLARSDHPNQEDSDRVVRVIGEFARAMGSEGIVQGQYEECQMNGEGSSWDEHLMNHVAEKKEGGMHACGAACGGILGGAKEEEIERLRRYGFYVGMMRGSLSSFSYGGKERDKRKRVEELGILGKREVDFFKGRNIEAISSFLDI